MLIDGATRTARSICDASSGSCTCRSFDFHLPIAQAPILILNAGVIGLNWALMRQRSGSIVVASVSHGIWNGLVYTLFNEGPTLGTLGIHNTGVFGPETDLIGLALNLAFAAVLWLGFTRGRGINADDMARPLRDMSRARESASRL